MNSIKQLQADKAEALDSARSIETEINDLVSYLCCDKFRLDTRVQVGDVLRVLLLIRNRGSVNCRLDEKGRSANHANAKCKLPTERATYRRSLNLNRQTWPPRTMHSS